MITTRCWSVFITILLSVTVTISLLSWLQTKSNAGEAEMHHPQGWRFTIPKGDATKGRAAFEKFACYVCHGSNRDGYGQNGRGHGDQLKLE